MQIVVNMTLYIAKSHCCLLNKVDCSGTTLLQIALTHPVPPLIKH